jgi:acyl transferase domain-containing protein/NADPH:quinone reductase-like Zn-dependent oxidoreductase/short-subunit dehydrogenase
VGEVAAKDVAWSLATGRAALSHRAVVVAADAETAAAGMAALASATPSADVIDGHVAGGQAARVAFVFSGQGSQRVGMGRELHAAFPVFAAAFDEAVALLDADLSSELAAAGHASLASVVLGAGDGPDHEAARARRRSPDGDARRIGDRDPAIGGTDVGGRSTAAPGEGRDGGGERAGGRGPDRGGPPVPQGSGGEGLGLGIDATVFAQAGLFAVEVALVRLLASFGVRADVVAGHSIGELAAAHVAGVFSLADACRLVAGRGRLMQALPEGGAMVALDASEHEARELVAGVADVSIAAVNAPRSVVVSGAADAVAELAEQWKVADGRAKDLRVSHAFHSPLVAPMLDAFAEVAASIDYRAPEVPLVSTLTGEAVSSDEMCTPSYWVDQARQAVRFGDAAQALVADGVGTFIEIGPDGQLAALVHDNLDVYANVEIVSVPALRPGRDERTTLLGALATAWCHGTAVDWPALVGGGRRVDLPTYPFQHRRYWPDEVAPAPAVPAAVASDDSPEPGPDDERVVALGEGEQLRALAEVVRAEAAAILGYDGAGSIEVDRAFKDLGLDSVSAVELRNRLSAVTGLRLPAALAFDHPTPLALAAELASRLGGGGPAAGAAAAAAAAIPASPVVGGDLDEPIAIVGVACRFPGGVSSPEGLWQLAVEGRDAITAFPSDRGWDALLPDGGGAFAHRGGFLAGATGFDAGLFGISPREALAMDPQQRLLLEVSWEALERAGLDPRGLRGSDTGVYVGLVSPPGDYGTLLAAAADPVEGSIMAGTTGSVASGRVSYVLGLEGPAVTVDTACSSSLVALHWAARSLRAGECSLALAGGVTVMATPAAFVEFAAQGGLAADGRCKAFGAGADGTGWSEGVGVVVVERLSDALRNGHSVWGLVRGSAINQDGASNGLTAPNGRAQQRVIRQALAAAGLSASDVDAVEAHGTGTSLGDPIEAGALLATYGQARSADAAPLYLGSLKANIGHTQAAAGIAGVIKMLMALRHGELPATLHADQPSDHIDWSSGAVELLTEPRPFPHLDRPSRAAVSSFGMSGTNAHLILEAAPTHARAGLAPPAEVVGKVSPGVVTSGSASTVDQVPSPPSAGGGASAGLGTHAEPVPHAGGASGQGDSAGFTSASGVPSAQPASTDRVEPPLGSPAGVALAEPGHPVAGAEQAAAGVFGVVPLVVAGASAEALVAQGEALRTMVRDGPASLVDLGWSLATGRAALEHRAVVVASDQGSAAAGLGNVATATATSAAMASATTAAASVVAGVASGDGASAVFVFPGQGAQWVGMAAELAAAFPVFRQAMDECEAAFAPLVDWSLVEVTSGPDDAWLDRVDVVQPALFAVMVSLAQLWRSFGVSPSAVVGHSQGEIAAACVAGALSLEDAARVVVRRAQLLSRLSGGGGMVSLALPEDRARTLIAPWSGSGHIGLATVNGPSSVTVSGDPRALEELSEACEAAGVRWTRVAVDYASHSPQVESIRDELLATLAGVGPRATSVPFWSTVTGGVVDGDELDAAYWYRNLREPVRFEPVVRALASSGHGLFVETSPHPGLVAAVQDTLDTVGRGGRAVGTLRRADGGAARLVRSLAEAWVQGAPVDWAPLLVGGRRIDLPTYPFRHRRYWPTPRPKVGADPADLGLVAAGHPLVSASVPLAGSDGVVLTGRLTQSSQPWLVDHVVGGAVVVPGVALVELALRAGRDLGCDRLDELVIEAPVVVPDVGGLDLQVTVGPPTADATRPLTIHTRPDPATPWTPHATGLLSSASGVGDGAAPLTAPGPAGATRQDTPDGPEVQGPSALAAPEQAGHLPSGSTTTADGEVASSDSMEQPAAWPTADSLGLASGRSGGVVAPPDGIEPLVAARPTSGGERLVPVHTDGVVPQAGGMEAPAAATPLVVDGLYERLAAHGLVYGPRFQGLRAAWTAGDVVFAGVEAPGDVAAGEFAVHPAVLDAALHALVLVAEPGDEVRLPFAWTGVRLSPWAGAGPLRVRMARLTDGPAGAVSVVVADASGQIVMSADALVLRTPPPTLTADVGAALHTVRWEPLEPATVGVPARMAVVGGGDLAALIEAGGITPERYADLSAIDGPAPDVVLVAAPAPDGDLPEAVQAGLVEVLGWLQTWLADDRFAASRLVLVTRNAVGDSAEGLVQAGMWGLVRSAETENPRRFGVVDLANPAADGPLLVEAVGRGLAEVAVRGGRMWGRRLGRAVPPPLPSGPWRLAATTPGVLADLVPRPTTSDSPALQTGEVRVEVTAAGLNFRDVLVALGVVEVPDGELLGGEGAGVVVEVGPGVDRCVPGDRVMGLLPGAMGSSAVADQRMIVRVPDRWTDAQAASVPAAFLTAYHGLVDVAGLRQGESVLVHSAAGGVGMAALQVARWRHAEVYATASPGKQAAVPVQPDRLASSRDREFADRFPSVDVVLNSLAGDLVDASLGLLGGGGRFVELGKTDIRDPEQVAADHPGVLYRPFDLVDAAGPDRIAEMLDGLVELFAEAQLTHLPLTTFPVTRAAEAFRHMSQARHTGKIVLTVPTPVSGTATALITGGTGGLGAHVARHLASDAHGVEHLVLVSRRGLDAPGAAELKAELETAGATVTIAAADVSDRQALADIVDVIPADTPLRTIVHAAGVLDDGVIGSLTPERLGKVVAPKVAGAWHLHELTVERHIDLDAFVLFSSAAGALGSAGQANYAAANTFLDALAAHRQGLGLAATSLAWGFWAEASGMTGHLGEADVARLRRTGFVPLPTVDGLALLDAAVGQGDANLVPARLDVAVLRSAARSGSVPASWGRLVGVSTDVAGNPPATAATGGEGLAARLAGLDASEAGRVVTQLVRTEAAIVLGHAGPDAVGPDRVFKDLGFDSLTAVELRNRLQGQTGLRLPATLVFDHPTPTALAAELVRSLGVGPASGAELAANATVTAAARAAATDEPLAIVGLACRFPGGANSPEALWQLLTAEGAAADAIVDFPTDRGWEGLAAANGAFVRRGGFLTDVAGFDAELFGISPREALAMDPQQRLLLEVTWEALERAGLDPDGRRGSDTGVFVGLAGTGYEQLVRPDLAGAGAPANGHGQGNGSGNGHGHTNGNGNGHHPDSASGTGGGYGDGIEGFGLTGGLASVATGRVAYVLGLEGPAVSVDTACSSSLVALHLACQSLRAGECSMALAGGVTVMATPRLFADFAAQGALAADGRCKPFGAGADGTGWSEGVGVVIVERLSDALRNGHEVWAVVRGSAVNQDGASNGLTAPNGGAQQRVIRRALANAGLSTGDVDAVEAHGTGTVLGDPIEAQAIIATYGQGRDDDRGQPVRLGSVKSNIGHTQAAAGVAGVIKMVMSLRHGVLPATLHAAEPSPHVDWTSGAVELLDRPRPWPADPTATRLRRAAVSSFGISGTNAHLILEQPPAPTRPTSGVGEPATPATASASLGKLAAEPHRSGDGPTDLGVVPVVVSAATEGALAAQAARLADRLRDDPGLPPTDLAWSLATTRAELDHRAVVLAPSAPPVSASRDAVLTGLDVVSIGARAADVITGRVSPGEVGFVFSGQGAQRRGMGRQLHATFPVFAEAFDRACELIDAELEVTAPLRSVVFGDDHSAALDGTLFAQTGLFALEVGLVSLLRDLGVSPSVVLGHSIGELVAAHIAGVFDLEDACRLVAARGRLMAELPSRGAMVALEATPAEAQRLVAGRQDRIALAAVNGPSAVVLSGDDQTIGSIGELWAARGRRVRRLRVSHAFHSPLIDPMLAELAEVAATIDYRSPRLALVSTVTGRLAGDEVSTPAYWVDQARRTVRFGDAVRSMVDEGVGTLVEIGPNAQLSALAQESFDPDRDLGATALLRPGRDEVRTLVTGLADAWVRGAPVDWARLVPGGRRVDLPTYPFQHRHFWPSPASLVRGPTLDPIVTVATWRYRVTWQLLALSMAPPASGRTGGSTGPLSKDGRPGRWLVLTTPGVDGNVAAWCHDALVAQGAEPVPVLLPGNAGTGTGAGTGACNDATGSAAGGLDRSTVASAIADALSDGESGGEPLAGILSLVGMDETGPDDSVATGLTASVAVVQALVDLDLDVGLDHDLGLHVDAPLWWVTRNAVATGDESVVSPAQAQVWGLGRIVGLEEPARWGGLVDLPPTLDDSTSTALAAVLAHAEGEDQLAIRPDGIVARRLVRAPAPSSGAWSTSGTALVTGGTGALAAHVAGWLVESGAEHVILASRRGPDAPGADELRMQIESAGGQVDIVTCDVADRDQLARLLGAIPAERPLRTIVHTAGASIEGDLDELTNDDLVEASSAKALGARNLHELTCDLDYELDGFVLFSSGAAVWGGGSQGAYAAANAYLDGLAEQRRALGLPATSLAWGPWAGGGMAEGETGDQLRRRGVHEMAPDLAVKAIDQALAAGETTVTVADIDWDRFAPAFAASRRRPLIEALPEAVRALAEDEANGAHDTGPGSELVRQLEQMDDVDRRQTLVDLVRAEVAAVLGHGGPAAVDPERSFKDLGFDSVTAVDLRNRLRAPTGLRLPATLVFDHPTPVVLAHELSRLLAPGPSSPADTAARHLSGLESLVADLDAESDGETLASVRAGLQRLLSRLSQSSSDARSFEEKLDAVDDDELLAFIDRELGSP